MQRKIKFPLEMQRKIKFPLKMQRKIKFPLEMQRKIKFPLKMQRKINIFFLFTTFLPKKMKKCQIQKNTFLSPKC